MNKTAILILLFVALSACTRPTYTDADVGPYPKDPKAAIVKYVAAHRDEFPYDDGWQIADPVRGHVREVGFWTATNHKGWIVCTRYLRDMLFYGKKVPGSRAFAISHDQVVHAVAGGNKRSRDCGDMKYKPWTTFAEDIRKLN